MIHRFPESVSLEEPFYGFTDPFRYVPHPAVIEAARLVIRDIESDPTLSAAFSEGKMLGVLVCRPSSESRNLHFLAAFSGNVGGRNHIAGFVPPIFDLLDPSGHFKTREAEITALNHRIESLSHSPKLAALEGELQEAMVTRDDVLDTFKRQMACSRIRREEVREQISDPSVLADLIKESQFEKAELKRLKVAWEGKIADIKTKIRAVRDEIAALKSQRARMSDDLQDWIFRQYIVHNALGESSSIADIFASQGLVPPGGTGECAAPKLLEYAYRNGLKPLAMGEFWYGRSPDTAVRTHGHFYPSCTSKCGPLLEYMLEGLREETVDSIGPLPDLLPQASRCKSPLDCLLITREGAKMPIPSTCFLSPIVIYEDDEIVVAEKPSGMPSVPGLDGRLSLEEYLTGATAAHRLDMDTSGVIVLAKTPEALANLQRQFESHTVRKTYMARICAPDSATQSWEGLFPNQCISETISLPLSPDYDERPRQKVDFKQGKAADTDYKVVQVNQDGTADLLMYPHTGRTHQLRVHCAHTLGLGRPIIGDLLYGGWSVSASPTLTPTQSHTPTRTQKPTRTESRTHQPSRLHLHALSITFRHPTTGTELTFTSRELCY